MLSHKATLDRMLNRALVLHGVRFDDAGKEVDLNKSVNDFLTTLAAAEPDPKEQAKRLVEAWEDKTGTLMRALNAIRVEQVGNYISSESHFMSAFFNSVSLKEDEEPYVHNSTMQEIRAGTIGEDGTPDQVRIVKPDTKTPIPLRVIASDIVKYKTLDVYKGRVDEIAKKTFNISADLTFRLDREFFNMLTASVANGGAFGAFSFEQNNANKTKRIYLAHSGIVAAHLPTTNDIVNSAVAPNDVPSTATSRNVLQYYDSKLLTSKQTGFRPAVLLATMNYADSWGPVLPDAAGGRLIPTGDIIVPASDIFNIARIFIPSANVVESRIQEEINRSGYTSISYMGKTWRFIPDVTIPVGTCYPRFNFSPGTAYFKPSMDKEFVETNEFENWERRWQRKVFGAYIISQHRPRALRIEYNS